MNALRYICTFLSDESDTNSTLQIRTWKLRKKRDRFLVSKVAFNLPISSEINFLGYVIIKTRIINRSNNSKN